MIPDSRTFLELCLALVLSSFFASLAVTPVVRALARRVRVLDDPRSSYRKIHRLKTPNLGGVAVFIGFFVPLAVLSSYRPNLVDLIFEGRTSLITFLAACFVVLAIGVFDDIRGLRPSWKLTGQVAAALVLISQGDRIEAITNPFGDPLSLGVLAVPVTVLWLVGCSNAINLMDGLDGLATGVAVFAGSTCLVVSLMFGNVGTSIVAAALVGSALGFLPYNFHRASIFLGDSGSLFLGFAVGAIAFRGSYKSEAAVALLIPIVALGLPIADTCLAIARRWLNHVPISMADRQHVHHRLLEFGLSQKQAVLALYAVSVVLAVIAILMTAAHNKPAAFLLATVGILLYVGVRAVYGLRISKVVFRIREIVDRQRKSRRIWECSDKIRLLSDVSQTPEDVWTRAAPVFSALGLAGARLTIFQPDKGTDVDYLNWRPDGQSRAQLEGGGFWSVKAPLPFASSMAGSLTVFVNSESLGTEEWPRILQLLTTELGHVFGNGATAEPPLLTTGSCKPERDSSLSPTTACAVNASHRAPLAESLSTAPPNTIPPYPQE